MRNLLAADIYRYRKDILFKVAFIVIAVFVAMNCGLYMILKSTLESADGLLGMDDMVSGRYLFGSSLSTGSNVGLVIPIFAGAIVCKDFSMGTIRNKIIRGYSRTQIYMSHFITSSCFGGLMIAVFALANLGLGSLLFGYSSQGMNAEQAKFVIVSLLAGIIVFAAMSAIVTLFATATGSMGLSIVLYVALTLGVSIIESVVIIIPKIPKFVKEIVEALPSSLYMNVCEGSLEWSFYAKNIAISIVLLVVLCLGGLVIFKKKDQK